MMQLFFATMLLACVTAVAAADAYPGPEWSVKCKHKTKHFELLFNSPSGDITEDDMQVSLRTSKGRVVKLAMPPALYTSHGAVTPIKNVCAQSSSAEEANAVAFASSDSVVLFWLSKDNRPWFNKLVLALVDIDSGKLLDYLDPDMEIKDINEGHALVIRAAQSGYQVRLIGEWLQDGVSDTAYSAIEYWMPVMVVNNKIKFTPVKSEDLKSGK